MLDAFDLSTKTVLEFAESWQHWLGVSSSYSDSLIVENLQSRIFNMQEQIYADKVKLSSAMTLQSWYVSIFVLLTTCILILLISKYYFDAKCEAWKWKSISFMNQIELLDSEAKKKEHYLTVSTRERELLVSRVQALDAHVSVLENQSRIDNIQLLEVCKTSHKIQTKNTKELAERDSEIIFERSQFISCKEGLEAYISDLKGQVEFGRKNQADRDEHHLKQVLDFEGMILEGKTLMKDMVGSRDQLAANMAISEAKLLLQESQRRSDRCLNLSLGQEKDHLVVDRISLDSRVQYLEEECRGAIKLTLALRAEIEELSQTKLALENSDTLLRKGKKEVEGQYLLLDMENSALHGTISGLNADLGALQARLLDLSASDRLLTARVNELESQCMIKNIESTPTGGSSQKNNGKTRNPPRTPSSTSQPESSVFKSFSPSTDEEAEEDGDDDEEEGAQDGTDNYDDDDRSVGSV